MVLQLFNEEGREKAREDGHSCAENVHICAPERGLKAIGDAVALDTATHFAFRDECMSCPVVQLC